MTQLFKRALAASLLLSSTVIGQDNYGDPSAPLILPTGTRCSKNILTLILTAYGLKDPHLKTEICPGWRSKIIFLTSKFLAKYLSKLCCFELIP
jgi:hypothetical protein